MLYSSLHIFNSSHKFYHKDSLFLTQTALTQHFTSTYFSYSIQFRYLNTKFNYVLSKICCKNKISINYLIKKQSRTSICRTKMENNIQETLSQLEDQVMPCILKNRLMINKCYSYYFFLHWVNICILSDMLVMILSFQKRGSKKPLVKFYSEYMFSPYIFQYELSQNYLFGEHKVYKKKNTKSNNDVFNNICDVFLYT